MKAERGVLMVKGYEGREEGKDQLKSVHENGMMKFIILHFN